MTQLVGAAFCNKYVELSLFTKNVWLSVLSMQQLGNHDHRSPL
jgi:hypothetical protein